MTENEQKRTIAILGGGFGGVQAAIKLGRFLLSQKITDTYEVILIDQNPYHVFTPTLYEAATTTDYIASNSQLKRIVTFAYKEIMRNLPVSFTQAKVSKIDTVTGELYFESGTALGYDWLILSPGSQVNFFNIPGLAEHALTLKSFTDGLRIREKIIEHVEGEEKPEIRVIIGGGGPTGVELAGEIKNLIHELPRTCEGKCADKVMIIDGGATILSAFDPRMIEKAQKRLKTLEVETMSGERISAVTEHEISLQSGKKIPYDVLIWTGGVKPSDLMQNLRMKKDPSNTRILTNEYMRCLPEQDDLETSGAVYGVGDAICFIDPSTDRPVPGVARAAITQARVAAHNVCQEILVKEKKISAISYKRFQPLKYPYILPVGGKFAIAKFGPFIISGLVGWTIKGIVELNYFISIFPVHRALKYWLKGLWIFLHNDRLG